MGSFAFFESTKFLPSTSSLLSLYASFSTSLMLLRNAYHELIPQKLESFLVSKFFSFFSFKKPQSFTTFIIDDLWDGLDHNKLMNASRFYLSSKINSNIKSVRVGKFRGQKNFTAALVEGEKIVDSFDGIEISWQFSKKEKDDEGAKGNYNSDSFNGYYEITFEDKYRDKVFTEYLPHIVKTSKDLTKGEKALKLFTVSGCYWDSVDFRHPANLDALAMDYELKKGIIDDLDRFLSRKDFYKRIGKPWKRGYLLYGPPGTGKSSLIAAMANYLKFNVYDLELGSIHSDAELRKLMLDIGRRTITVIEDIDCSSSVKDRSKPSSDDSTEDNSFSKKISLSSLLNCIDGLWSSCGEERIIVFTTNHKEVLDPALLRPGRMDVHIHMSYCTVEGFRVLASNYLEIEEHKKFEEIDELIKSVEATPASLAEELLSSDDADVALANVVNFLKQKKDKLDTDRLEQEKKSSLDPI